MKESHVPTYIILILKAAGITALAYLLSQLLISPYTASLSALFSSNDKTDFKVSDLFMQVADNRPVRVMEDNLVMVDVGRSGREEIADILFTLAECEPRLVGLDINFEYPGDNDSILIEALSALPSLVLPLGLNQDGDKFVISERPFFYESYPQFRYGAINFPTSAEGETVREFPIQFALENGDTLPSLVVAMAETVAPQRIRQLRESGDETRIISYHSKELKTIPFEEIIDHAEEFKDKVVLVGTTSETSDIHSIPLRRGVSGLEIHAYALSTLLQGENLKKMPQAVDTVVAILLCFFIVLGAIGIKNGVRGLVVRIAQLSALYFLVRIGYGLLVDKDTVADFSQSILMITFGLLSVDVWNGTAALISLINKRTRGTAK